ncbi:hypothetical protein LZ30DRAFT_708091 [Colletotrichum cereale]|nr:hypothetical protein LZ30DRAFT_708091 [Colletotrichum cereale]
MRLNCLISLLPTLPAGPAATFADPPAGVREFTPQWEFEPFPGEKIVLNGTVEQVVAELAQINPDYSPFAPAASGDQGPALERRQKAKFFPRDRVLCKKPGRRNVHTSEIDVGIRYLGTVKGQFRGDPGPANCVGSAAATVLPSGFATT